MLVNLRSRKGRRAAQHSPSAAAILSVRAVLYALLASSVLMIGYAVRNPSPPWLLPGFVLLFAAAILKSQFERRLRVLREPQLRERLQVLLRRVREGERLFIHGSPGWLAPIATTALGAGLLFEGIAQSAVGFTIIGGICFVAPVIWERRPSHLKKPVLVLSGQGLEAPPFECISWQRVLQISLKEVEVRNVHLHYELQVMAHGLRNRLPGAKTPLQRFWRRLRRAVKSNKARITLRHTDEDPQMIGSLADLLWRSAQRASFEAMDGEMIDAIARTKYDAALMMEQDLDIIRRAARAEPLDFDFSALNAAAADHQATSEPPTTPGRDERNPPVDFQ